MPQRRREEKQQTIAGQALCPKRDQPWVLAATILGSSMAFIDGTVVNVALPALQKNLNATVVDVQWVVESYGLVLSALLLVGGSLGDVLGRRIVFLVGVALFALASVACGLSSTIDQLILARGAQGIGAAAMVPGSLALISASFDDESRGRAIGTWSGFTAITTAFGPVLGGYLIEHASWHWVFLINAPLAVVVILIALRFVPESRNPEAKRVDWLGAIIATAALLGIVFGFLESSTLGWRHPLVYGSTAAGVLLLLMFFVVERRVAIPMMPLDLFRSRNFSGANLLTLLLYAGLSIFFFVFPMNLIQMNGYSATAAGAATLPFVALMFLLSRWSGGLVSRYGARLPLMLGPSIAAAGFMLFMLPGTHASYWKAYLPAFLVLGLGMAISVAPLTTVVMSSVAKERGGVASGVNNSVSRFAGVLAIAVLGPLMVQIFGATLSRDLSRSQLPQPVIAELQAHRVNLGALQPPSSLDADSAKVVRRGIESSFQMSFRWIMAISAVLALASAGVSWRMISPAPPQDDH